MSEEILEVTDVQIYVYGMNGYEDAGYGVNYAINDSFMIQYDAGSGDFSISHPSEAKWNDEGAQEEAHHIFDADKLAKKLKLPKTIKKLCDRFVPDWYGDEKQIEFLKKKKGV